MISSRQKLILKTIVESYITEEKPIGSLEITSKPYLNFSSATIRFDMANLEEMGLIKKPHTSGGRIPSDLGYKFYVENLITIDETASSYYEYIDDIFKENFHQKSEAIKKSLSWLSELTNTTVLTYQKPVSDIKIIKIIINKINKLSAVLLILTSDQKVHSQVINFSNEFKFDIIEKQINFLEKILLERNIDESILLLNSNELKVKENINTFIKLKLLFLDLLSRIKKENINVMGIFNLFKNTNSKNVDEILNYLNSLNEFNLNKVISTVNKINVLVGNEIEFMKDAELSIISIPYQAYENDVGQVLIVGSKRMHYKKVVPLLERIAYQLSQLFKIKEDN